jgi:hypothetical protein
MEVGEHLEPGDEFTDAGGGVRADNVAQMRPDRVQLRAVGGPSGIRPTVGQTDSTFQ